MPRRIFSFLLKLNPLGARSSSTHLKMITDSAVFVGETDGWLLKKSNWFGEWRERYLKVNLSSLTFHELKTSPPHMTFDYKSIKTVAITQENGIKVIKIIVEKRFMGAPKSENVYIRGFNDDETLGWHDKIEKIISKYGASKAAVSYNNIY